MTTRNSGHTPTDQQKEDALFSLYEAAFEAWEARMAKKTEEAARPQEDDDAAQATKESREWGAK